MLVGASYKISLKNSALKPAKLGDIGMMINVSILMESSFNMTRGMKILRGVFENF